MNILSFSPTLSAPCIFLYHSLFLTSQVLLKLCVCLLLRRFAALATASISAPYSHRDQSQVTPAFKSLQPCADNQAVEFKIQHGGDFSCHSVLQSSFYHTTTSPIPTHRITSFLASPVQLFDVSASDLHFTDPSSFLLFSICSFLIITTKTYGVLPPTPTTYTHTFSHSRKPVFYTSQSAAAQWQHYAPADTKAWPIRRGQ